MFLGILAGFPAFLPAHVRIPAKIAVSSLDPRTQPLIRQQIAS
jgi:hypothetical protein